MKLHMDENHKQEKIKFAAQKDPWTKIKNRE